MKPICFFLILALALGGCTKAPAPVTQVAQAATDTSLPPATSPPLPTATSTRTTTPTPTPPPTSTPTVTPTATPTQDPRGTLFDSKWVQAYYPNDWKFAEPSENKGCAFEEQDCIFHLFHSESEDVSISMSKLPLQGVTSIFSLEVDKDDQQNWQMLELWAMMNGVKDKLKSVSRTKIEVDGLPAIRRLYEKPLLDESTNEFKGIEYNYEVLVIKDQTHYYFNMRTTNSDEFEQYQPVADQILTTVVFLE